MLDVPGFGASPPVGARFDLDEVADELYGAVAADAPFDLVGHSLGAALALKLATRHTRALRRLVLVAPAGIAPVPRLATRVLAHGVEPALAVRRRAVALTDLRSGRRVLLGLAAGDAAAISPTQARLIVNASRTATRAGAAFAAVTAADLRSDLRTLRAPLGLIWGAEDRTIPARTAELVRAERPDVEAVTIERAGHVVMVERPDEFTAALGDLLARLPKDATSPSAPAPSLS
jgi:pimeloyl-ACP methyl ester carboxylesterase